jgi:hypothetical protein
VLFDQPALRGHPWRCAGAVQEGRCHSMTLCRPLSYFLHIAPLERGWWHPRKGYNHLPRTRPGRHRDVRLAGHIFPVTVPPSQALKRHPQHCGNPGRQDIITPAVVQPPIFRQPSPRIGVRTTTKRRLQRYHPRSRPWTSTGPATTPARGKIRQDGRQLHDTVCHATAHSS